MVIYHKDLEHRFSQFTKTQQLLMICNELNRVKHVIRDREERNTTLYRAMELLDFSTACGVWQGGGLLELRRAREVMAGYTVNEEVNVKDIDQLMQVMIRFDPEAYKMLNPTPKS